MTKSVKYVQKKPWYQRTGTIVLGVIILVLVIFFGWFIKGYNNMTYSQQNVEQQEGQVQNVLQRRGDVIPELMGAVKGSQKQERNVYGTIAKARTQYYNASNKYSKANNPSDKANDLNEQNHAFNVMVGSIKENYPNLASNGQMDRLSTEIEGSNNRISVERRTMNQDIQQYNSYVSGFPTNILAGMTNHHAVPYFHADTKAQTAPKVSF